MPLSTAPSFPAGKPTWPTIAPTDKLGDNNKELLRVVTKIENELSAVIDRVGVTNSADNTSLTYKANGFDARATVNVNLLGVKTTNTGAQNTTAFNTYESLFPTAVDFVFPPGTYNSEGFTLSKSNHRLVGAAGMFGSVLNFTKSGTGGALVTILGTAVGGFDGRVEGCGLERLTLTNSAAEDNRALVVKHATGCVFQYLKIELFRGQGAVYASNFADSMFFHCDWQFCGSTDDSDYAVIQFGYDGNGVWGVDQITFLRCKWEVNGDRLLDFRDGSGFFINKINFISCKFESSGTESYKMGGSLSTNGAQFWLQGCSNINYIGCDFTLQDLRAGHAILPTIFRLKGSSDVHLATCQFNFGSGSSPKCFTNFFVCDASAQLLVLTDVWINSGNSTAFPTVVLKATNTPRLSMSNVGFTPTQGGSKVATAFYTSAEWSSGGVIA